MAALTHEDREQVERYRATATERETAEFAARLYEKRNTPPRGYLAGLPRGLVVLTAAWLVMIESAEKLPMILTAVPRYKATVAEAQAKQLQPDLVRAQVMIAQFQANAAEFEPRAKEAQAVKIEFEAQAARMTPAMTAAQLIKAGNDAKTSAIQPELTAITLAKTRWEAQAAAFQPGINRVQLSKLGVEATTAAHQQGLTASQAIQAEQSTAMTQAGLSLLLPYLPALTKVLKDNNINLPMDQLAAALGIINPAARTSDLRGAMLDRASAPLAAPVAPPVARRK